MLIINFSYKNILAPISVIAPITVTETINRDNDENYIIYNYQGGLAYISLDINLVQKKKNT